jgi:hypothetical protein
VNSAGRGRPHCPPPASMAVAFPFPAADQPPHVTPLSPESTLCRSVQGGTTLDRINQVADWFGTRPLYLRSEKNTILPPFFLISEAAWSDVNPLKYYLMRSVRVVRV